MEIASWNRHGRSWIFWIPTLAGRKFVNRSSLPRIVVGAALLVAGSLALPAQDAKLAAEKRTQIEQAISKFMAANQVPGLSAAVVENGQYAWSAGFGMADLEGFVPATSQTLYRLASVSKPLTAVATMQLSERGKLYHDAHLHNDSHMLSQSDGTNS